MKHKIKRGITAVAITFASISFAQEAEKGLELTEVALNGAELQLKFSETRDVPNACPLTVKRMELIESIHTLLVELKAPQKCLIDLYGKRKGTLKWNLPAKYRSAGKLQILANDRALGTLLIANNAVTFQKN